MRVPDESLLNRTLAFHDADSADAAIAQLADIEDPIITEGLVEVVCSPPAATAAVSAIKALRTRKTPIVNCALTDALTSDRSSIFFRCDFSPGRSPGHLSPHSDQADRIASARPGMGRS